MTIMINNLKTSARKNTKGKIKCIAIIMTYPGLTFISIWHCDGKKPLNDNLQQGFGQNNKADVPFIYI